MTNTPRRSVRVDNETWQRARDRATENAETVADVVRRALERYARTPPAARPTDPAAAVHVPGQLGIWDPQ